MIIGGRGLSGSCMTCGVTCVETIELSSPPVMFILILLVYKDASAVNPGNFALVILLNSFHKVLKLQ